MYMKILITEDRVVKLKKYITDYGIRKAVEVLRGFENLVKVLGYETVTEYLYQYLTENYYPDYGWSDHNYYSEQVDSYGAEQFKINDKLSFDYTKHGNGNCSLDIYPWLYNELVDIFDGYDWVGVVKKWFEDNTGLKVDMVQ
jgi:hypothetical protein